jgi:hypothetical protein
MTVGHVVDSVSKPLVPARFRRYREAMEESSLIGPEDTAYRLELTAAQLKVTHTALRSLLDDFGHDEREVQAVIHEVLAKLPGEHEIRAIDLSRELRRRRAELDGAA